VVFGEVYKKERLTEESVEAFLNPEWPCLLPEVRSFENISTWKN